MGETKITLEEREERLQSILDGDLSLSDIVPSDLSEMRETSVYRKNRKKLDEISLAICSNISSKYMKILDENPDVPFKYLIDIDELKERKRRR